MDLAPDSRGAVHLVRWLVESGVAAAKDVLAVHVIETEHLLSSMRPFGPGTLPDALLPMMRQRLTTAKLSEARAEIVETTNAEHGLAEVVARHEADLLVVGRRGTPSSFVRLGRVARRLLRSLPTAVAVTPAGLEPEKIGPGPVLLATDLGSSDTSAIAFARRVANESGSGLAVVHIVPTPTAPHTAYVRAGLEPLSQQERMAQHRQHLDAWRRDHGLEDAEAILESGELVESLMTVAEACAASLIVCGSRHLSASKRLFVSSVASTLAGLAEHAVVTVPGAPES